MSRSLNAAPAFAGVVASIALAACTAQQNMAIGTPPSPVAPVTVAAPFQYLYGSGEGAAQQMTAFHALIAYVTDKAVHRPADSVVLAPGSPLVHAQFVPCGAKPLAAVFDADETVLLNTGFEADEAVHPGRAYDEARWQAWERTGKPVATPGAAHAFGDLRKAGVTIVINTNRSTANAALTAASLKAAGLGEFRPGETLYTRDAGAPSGKDARRAAIAARYCVIAMAGDQLGDFSDRFNDAAPFAQRRQLSVHSSAAGLWGKGWFVLPNPVYGTALKGSAADVFPTSSQEAN